MDRRDPCVIHKQVLLPKYLLFCTKTSERTASGTVGGRQDRPDGRRGNVGKRHERRGGRRPQPTMEDLSPGDAVSRRRGRVGADAQGERREGAGKLCGDQQEDVYEEIRSSRQGPKGPCGRRLVLVPHRNEPPPVSLGGESATRGHAQHLHDDDGRRGMLPASEPDVTWAPGGQGSLARSPMPIIWPARRAS